MILLLFFIVGLLIGFMRGGDLAGLVHMKIRWIGLVILSFLAERSFVIIPVSVFQSFPALLPALQLVRFLPLLLFVCINARNWRISIAGVGIALNFAVIAVNAWRMPVSWQAATISEIAKSVVKMQAGGMPEYVLMGGQAGANLWFLADILPVKIFAFIPTYYASPGDFLLGLGVMLAVQQGMVGYTYGKHMRKGSKMQSLPVVGQEPELDAHADVAPAVQSKITAPPSVIPTKQEPVPAAPAINKEPDGKPMPKDTDGWGRHAARSKQTEPALPSAGRTPVDPAGQPRADRPDKDPQRSLDFLQTLPVTEFATDNTSGIPGQPNIPIRLTPRLEVIARMAERGTCVADVGCDHGKLGAWLALKGVPRVIAMDVSVKSLEKTKQLVDELDLNGAIQTRVSDGLKKLRYGEADILVMAGMGGPTMVEILEAGREKALAADKLVLQPMNAIGTVRKWLVDNGFRISDERLAEEDRRIYQILAATPGDDPFPPMSLFDLEVGRLLIDCRHPLLGRLLDGKIQTIDTILSEIAENATPKADARRNELMSLRARCAEVRECLAAE